MCAAPLDPQKALNFFSILGKLKELKRTGWIHKEIPNPESVADHMYRLSMLVFALADSTINKDHLIKICLVHDLAEAIAGDITPECGVSKEEKRRLEENALKEIVSDFDNEELSKDITSLWLEYEENETNHSKIAHQLDKFEFVIQSNEYEIMYNKRLDSFFENTKNIFTHPEIVSWDKLLREKRDKRISEII